MASVHEMNMVVHCSSTYLTAIHSAKAPSIVWIISLYSLQCEEPNDTTASTCARSCFDDSMLESGGLVIALRNHADMRRLTHHDCTAGWQTQSFMPTTC